MTDRPHPKSFDLYTPFGPHILELLDQMRREHGGTWRDVAAVTDTRLRVLRYIRTGARRTVSMSLLDRMITTTGVGSLQDYEWYTPEQLVDMGLWDDVYEGYERWVASGDEPTI